MQKKIYIGGLPWELDRIGLLNYFKAVLEGNDIPASYELPFVTSPTINPNAIINVVDVFVALERQAQRQKSRGFGFITLDILSDDAEELFVRVVDMLNQRIMIGIRGPRELIVKEADPRAEGDNHESRESRRNSGEAEGETAQATEGGETPVEGEAAAPAAEGDVSIDW